MSKIVDILFGLEEGAEYDTFAVEEVWKLV